MFNEIALPFLLTGGLILIFIVLLFLALLVLRGLGVLDGIFDSVSELRTQASGYFN